MAAPTYNCPFSATGGATEYVMTCADIQAANTAAGCPLYDATREHCTFALALHTTVRGGTVDAPDYDAS